MLLAIGFGLFYMYDKGVLFKGKDNDEKQTDSVVNNDEQNNEEDRKKLEEEKEKKYKECMEKPYKMDSLEAEFSELFKSYDGRNLSLYFKDIKNDYSFSLDPNRIYYSGCVVKLFVTIYLVERARAGEIDLHDTLTYLPQDKHAYSDLTDQHEFYEEIPITTLMDYYLTISDNSAYMIIMRSFGSSNINQYFWDKYGIELPFTDSHPFIANYNANIANRSLELLYNVLQIDDEYTALIKKAMDNDEENALNFDNVRILHKYGELAPYHNDIGIYDSDYPYLVSVLSLYANDDYMGKISSVSRDMYNIYKKNLDAKEAYCRNEI